MLFRSPALYHLHGFGDQLADSAVTAKLKAVNETLWDIEDRIRAKESAKAFDAEFIELARSVYIRNDERAALKKQRIGWRKMNARDVSACKMKKRRCANKRGINVGARQTRS